MIAAAILVRFRRDQRRPITLRRLSMRRFVIAMARPRPEGVGCRTGAGDLTQFAGFGLLLA